MDAAIQVVQFYEANYPEYLRRVFVINGECSDTIYFLFDSAISFLLILFGLVEQRRGSSTWPSPS